MNIQLNKTTEQQLRMVLQHLCMQCQCMVEQSGPKEDIAAHVNIIHDIEQATCWKESVNWKLEL